jgi:membrane-bound lytic murein transglycosylase D
MIESGLVAHATSKAKAVGLWQFMVATGAMYGLEVNYWIDERRDPEKATRAAARHLRDLYNIWGDWHLSIANYNVSPRRMKWAISKSNGVKNYWVIYPYLPKETRGYVPSFIATTIIATNAEQFGFKKNYGGTPYQYEIVEIEGSIRLDVLARCAGISVDSLRFWNPELIRWATPPGKSPYPLKLPVGLKAQFEQRLSEISDAERKLVAVHIVKSGETLGRIAAKYGTTVKELYAVNPSLPPKLQNGQEIIIPVPPASATRITANMPSGASRTDIAQQQNKRFSKPNSAHIVYTIKPGDTIASIANAHKVSAEDLRLWNNTDNKIKAGQKLIIYASQKKAATPSKQASMQSRSGYSQYTVRSNDTLFEIARRFGLNVEELKRVNNLKNNIIQPGQVLYVPES